jgi:hypothetical protein
MAGLDAAAAKMVTVDATGEQEEQIVDSSTTFAKDIDNNLLNPVLFSKIVPSLAGPGGIDFISHLMGNTRAFLAKYLI